LNASGSSLFVAVVGYQIDNPRTGGYTSSFVELMNPMFDYNILTSTTVEIKVMAGAIITGAIKIPRTVVIGGNIYNITKIADNGFSGTCITSITFEGPTSNVINIGAYAFANCNSLTAITIPNSVTTISSFAFWACPNIENLTIPLNVTNIGASAFGNNNKLMLFAASSSKPTGWHTSWNYDNKPVHWNNPTQSHNYLYTSSGSSGHTGTCSVCSHVTSENHNLYYTAIYFAYGETIQHQINCGKCNYQSVGLHKIVNGNITCCAVIYPNSPPHDHEMDHENCCGNNEFIINENQCIYYKKECELDELE